MALVWLEGSMVHICAVVKRPCGAGRLRAGTRRWARSGAPA